MTAVTTPNGEKPQPPGRGAGGRVEGDDTAQAPRHTGGMIALIPSREDLDKLVVDGGEPLEELHLTITYLGENVAESLDQATRAAMLTDVAAMAAGMPPIEAEVMGHGSFNPSGGDDGEKTPCAVYLVSGAAELPILYEDLGSYASEDAHPIFLPHITAGYNLDVGKLSYVGPIRFDHVRIALGDQVSDIALSGEPEDDEIGGAEDALDDDAFADDDMGGELGAAGPSPLDVLDDEAALEDEEEPLDDFAEPAAAPAEPAAPVEEEPAEEGAEPADDEGGLPALEADDEEAVDISPEEVAEAESVDGEEPAEEEESEEPADEESEEPADEESEEDPEEEDPEDDEEEDSGKPRKGKVPPQFQKKAVQYSTNDRIAASAGGTVGKGTYAAGKTATQIKKEKEAAAAAKKSGAKRKVASKAGEQRYGLPIGTELGQSRGGKAADDARNDKRGAELYDQLRGKSAADQKKYLASLNDDDAKKLHALLYSTKSSNEAVVAARIAASADLKRRGIDPGQHGSLAGKGGPAKPKAKAPAKSKAPAKGVAAKYAGRSSVDYGKIPESDWDALLKAGWKGKAGDNAERLYPPGKKSAVPLEDTTWYLDEDWMTRRQRRVRAGLQGRPGSRIPRRLQRTGEYKQLLTLHVFDDTSWSYK